MDSAILSRRSLPQAIAATIATTAQMTIQALAFRAGEHIARIAKRGEISRP